MAVNAVWPDLHIPGLLWISCAAHGPACRRHVPCLRASINMKPITVSWRQPERGGMDKLAYSIEEVTDLTGLSRDLLYDEMNAGRLAYVKVGRRRIITRQAIETFLNRQAA